jgi:hypothetical protein
MTEHQSSRTLVKSAPELWAECSDAASLARHLGAFGEIRITKLEPETTVAWEGTAASGTVKLETSGWGTRVTLTLKEDQSAAPETAVVAPDLVVEPEPVVAPEPVGEPELVEEPEPVAALDPVEEPAAVEPEPIAIDPEPAPRRGMFTRLRRFRRKPAAIVESATPQPEASEPKPVAPLDPGPAPAPVPEPVPVATAPPEPEPVAEAPPEPAAPPEPEPPRPTGEEALVAALDSLGMAHHRPYSRS